MNGTRFWRWQGDEQVQALLLAVSFCLGATAVWALCVTAGSSECDQTAREIPPLVILDAEAPEEKEPIREVPRFSRIIENATVTHYCICEKCCGKTPDDPAYGITASGREAVPYYSVAVDPFFIELGSTLYMDFGDGVLIECRADDTGIGVNGAHIDYCVSDHQEALELGVKTAVVYIEEVA